ncbi:MAG: sulfite exporter TauE/SafE family protein [Oscillospiraceae bacterium]|nr:sulfite exporter TauE/SafE family protein [Oscillospiraceae bacterium]
MSIWTYALVGLLSGVAASMGFGGGMVLLIYLTTIAGIPQLMAQGVNLLFFLPIALISLIINLRSHLVDLRGLLPSLITGALFAALFSFVARFLGGDMLRKGFGVLVVIAGLRELFKKKKDCR